MRPRNPVETKAYDIDEPLEASAKIDCTEIPKICTSSITSNIPPNFNKINKNTNANELRIKKIRTKIKAANPANLHKKIPISIRMKNAAIEGVRNFV